MVASREMALNGIILLVLALAACDAKKVPLDACFKTCTPAIPKWHLYHRLCKPVIIGHRGDPLHYQENSLEGFKSVHKRGIEAFELDVFLTKDKQLVLFHDRNTLRTTGVNRKIQDMTAKEATKLRYLRKIKYGPRTFKYNRRRKVVLLEKVLRWANGKRILLLIEMKPSDLLLNVAGVKNSMETGQAVAKLVKKYKMHKQVIVISFNYFATLSAKRAFPKLVAGTFMPKIAWQFPAKFYRHAKTLFSRLMPGLKTCLSPLPDSNKVLDFLLLSGTMDKSIQASVGFLQLGLFNNPLYGGAENKNTMAMIKKNYGSKFVVGTGGFYDMKTPRKVIKSMIPLYRYHIKLGVKMIVTDDLVKTKKLVIKTNNCNCYSRRYRNKKHHDVDVTRQDNEIEAVQRG